MKDLTTAEAAYIAGILDGEGYLALRVAGGARLARPHIEVANSDVRLIDWLQDCIGGKRTTYTPKSSKAKVAYKLFLDNREDVLKLLEAVRPYLVIKGERADLIFDYVQNVEPTLGGEIVSVQSLLLSVEYRDKMDMLNRRGR